MLFKVRLDFVHTLETLELYHLRPIWLDCSLILARQKPAKIE